MDANLQQDLSQNNLWGLGYYQYDLYSRQWSQQQEFQQKIVPSQKEYSLENERLEGRLEVEMKNEIDLGFQKLLNPPFTTQPDSLKNTDNHSQLIAEISQRKLSKCDLDKTCGSIKPQNPKCGKTACKFIFKEKCVKKITKKFAISKFLVRLFLKYHSQYEVSPETSNYNSSVKAELQRFNQNKFNLQRDAMKFLNPNVDENFHKISQENRFVMANILQDKIREEVIMNTATQRNRISYLIGSKIYSLRCRSKELCRKANFR